MVRITPGSFPQGLPQSLGARGRFGHAGISPSPTGFSNQPSFSPSPQPGMESLETVDEDPERGDPPETFPSSGGPDSSTQPQMLSRPPGIDLFPRSPPVSEATRAHTHPSGFGTPSNRRDFLGRATPLRGQQGYGYTAPQPTNTRSESLGPSPGYSRYFGPPSPASESTNFRGGSPTPVSPQDFRGGSPMGFRAGSPSSVPPQDFRGGSTDTQSPRGTHSEFESTASILAHAIKMATSASSDQPDKLWSEKKRLPRDSGLFKAISFIQDVTEKVRGGENFSARLRVVDEFGDPLKLFLRSDGMDTSIPEHVSEGDYSSGRLCTLSPAPKWEGFPRQRGPLPR